MSDRGSVLGSNAHESVEFGNMKRISMSQADMSEAGTDIVRKEMSQADYDKFNRLSTNKDLSGLTNQVLELILDNVKMTHMNQKLSEYCRSQGKRLEAHTAASVAEKAQAQVHDNLKAANSTPAEILSELNTLKLELEGEQTRRKELIVLVEHERHQFERTMKENKYRSRKDNSELHEQINSLRQ
jgi:hypothetical protein